MTAEISGRKHTNKLISKAEYEALQGNFHLAESLLREAIRELERTLQMTTTDLAIAKHNLISALEPQGKTQEAGNLRQELCQLLTAEIET